MITKNKIKFIKSLSLKKYRNLHQCFIVEGEKNVLELLDSNFEILELYATDNWEKKKNNIQINHITEKELKRISGLECANKVLAIVKIPKKNNLTKSNITLVLDNIKDPGNIGTIIRLCDWFGVRKIICSEYTVDIYNPKVIQSSMGSIFRVNVSYTNITRYLKKIKEPIYAGFLNGEDIREVIFPDKLHLVLGNEANGISDQVAAVINKKITIKKLGGKTNSLNVSTATAIFLYKICN